MWLKCCVDMALEIYHSSKKSYRGNWHRSLAREAGNPRRICGNPLLLFRASCRETRRTSVEKPRARFQCPRGWSRGSGTSLQEKFARGLSLAPHQRICRSNSSLASSSKSVPSRFWASATGRSMLVRSAGSPFPLYPSTPVPTNVVMTPLGSILRILEL